MILERLCGWIGGRAGVFLLTPHAAGLGDCAEEIYFGLLKARREGKKLLLLFPREIPGRTLFGLCNRALFDVASPYRWGSESGWASILGGWLLTFLYAPLCLDFRYRDKAACGELRWSFREPASIPRVWAWKVLYAPFRIAAWFLSRFVVAAERPPAYPLPLVGKELLWQPGMDAGDFTWERAADCRWPERFNEPLPVALRAPSRSEAERMRGEMGLPAGAWFACLHVREGGYYAEGGRPNVRNATIARHLKAVEAVTARGGWVVRLGDPSMTPLPPMERVIDYPHTRFKSELMDIYMLSACRFFLGMISGPLEAALLFQKPIVLTNEPCWFVIPPRKGDLGILKHVYSRSRGRFLSLREVLEQGWGCQFFIHPIAEDYVLHENSPEEIRDVVVEFLERDAARAETPLQAEFNRRRQEAGRELLAKPIFPDDRRRDAVARSQAAAWLFGQGALGEEFLRQNWERSARNPSD